jgi:hypothetical protein
MELIDAKTAVKRLQIEAGVKISEQRFGALKRKDTFKVHRKPGSRKDWFLFDEVVSGYFNFVTPRTDEQHEVHHAHSIRAKLALVNDHMRVENFNIPDGFSPEAAENELVAANTLNTVLLEVARDLIAALPPKHHSQIASIIAKAAFSPELMQMTFEDFAE